MLSRSREAHTSFYPGVQLGNRSADLIEDGAALPFWIGRWVIRFRGALMKLNYNPHAGVIDRTSMCALCNLGVVEDVHHFLAVCPVLGEFRARFLGAGVLLQDEVVSILNNRERWEQLANYGRVAWRYRAELIAEFNW